MIANSPRSLHFSAGRPMIRPIPLLDMSQHFVVMEVYWK